MYVPSIKISGGLNPVDMGWVGLGQHWPATIASPYYEY